MSVGFVVNHGLISADVILDSVHNLGPAVAAEDAVEGSAEAAAEAPRQVWRPLAATLAAIILVFALIAAYGAGGGFRSAVCPNTQVAHARCLQSLNTSCMEV